MSSSDIRDESTGQDRSFSRRKVLLASTTVAAASAAGSAAPSRMAQAQQPAPTAPTGQRPNIIVIMGDDIGMWNIGAYHRGMMAGRTPNLDRIAAEGMLFTDYYAEASCTAGRAAFITGELPIRTGMTTVGQAGAPTGLPAQAVTIATALKGMGYATGQLGKNHLGDKNEFLPTVHGFDEFFGYLYHLDAMEDPAHPAYPQELLNKVGPRNMVHSWATSLDDPTVDPRWGKIGKQKIEDAGTLYPKRMETVDDEIRDLALNFIDKAKAENKPFFVWLNPTRMHVTTHLSPKYQAMRNSKNAWTIHEAGMAQLDGHGLRLYVVHPQSKNHRQRVRAVGLGTEPRFYEQGWAGSCGARAVRLGAEARSDHQDRAPGFGRRPTARAGPRAGVHGQGRRLYRRARIAGARGAHEHACGR
jgi:arylsulfatase